MLTVTEAAGQLGVSASRVRALIKAGMLPATKHGRAWMLREEDVLQRLMDRPRSGRPKRQEQAGPKEQARCQSKQSKRAHEAYELCRELFLHCPSQEMMDQAASQEEVAFYMAASTFFLQQQQAELIAAGVY